MFTKLIVRMDNKCFGFFRFKDGKAYPWPGDVSSFILYPESANQTIYSQALSSVDAGNYTCTVANESQVLTHTAALTVFGMLHFFCVVEENILGKGYKLRNIIIVIKYFILKVERHIYLIFLLFSVGIEGHPD